MAAGTTTVRNSVEFHRACPLDYTSSTPSEYARYDVTERNARDESEVFSRSLPLTSRAKRWYRNYWQPYKGFTSDGVITPGLWSASAHARGPSPQMVRAAKTLLSVASTAEKSLFRHLITAREWRSWSDPEILLIDSGIRGEEMTEETRYAADALLGACLSQEGYQKILLAMSGSSTLDALSDRERIDRLGTYQFCLFGEPSMNAPWGFNVSGHNVSYNVFTLSGELVIGPYSMSADRDAGMDDSICQLLHREESAGLALMRSLSPEQQELATLRYTINDLDGSSFIRTVGGAHQDNRVVPYSGICATQMNDDQRRMLLSIIRLYNELLPQSSLDLMMRRVEEHLHETYFAWAGMIDEAAPFYFRIHSPLILNELDHEEMESIVEDSTALRIHATQRLPNRGDYGAALLDEWVRRAHKRT